MKPLRGLLLLGLCMAIASCAQMTSQGAVAATGADASDRQILVMLRAPPPHFRPDIDYAPGYDSRVRHGGQRRIVEDLARHYDLKLITDWPMPALGVDCFVLEAPSREAIAQLVDEIARDARVESAQAMNVFHVLAHNDPLYPLQPGARLWHLAEVHRITTGRDVRIAQIDTGVDADHPDLRGRIAAARDFVGAPAPAGEAHGTAVAGIIGARADDGIGIAGVAPEAKLFVLRACRQEPDQPFATCTSFTLAKALQFALDQKVQVINLSLGGPRDRLLERLLDAGLARRIIIVSAADPRASGGGFPASHPGVLAVATPGAENLPAGALIAPGRDVPATSLGQSWAFVSGSSYAAAEVSGAAALMLQRAPALDAAQVRDALAPGTVSGPGIDQPAMVDVCAAIARTTSACVCGCVVVARDAIPGLAP
jgi:subtilisin family serine protease